MEMEGKEFLVIYQDDEGQRRTKNMIFVEKDDDLMYFQNAKTGKTEVIQKERIIRMQEVA